MTIIATPDTDEGTVAPTSPVETGEVAGTFLQIAIAGTAIAGYAVAGQGSFNTGTIEATNG